jgi:integrase
MATPNHAKSQQISAHTSTGLAKRAAPRRFHFTDKRLRALPLSTNGQRAYFYDDEVRGLGIAVSPRGKRSFVLYRFVAGRPERVQMGVFPDDLSVDQARRLATQMNAAIAQGKNPAAERRAVRDEMTLGELFETFLTLYAKQNKRTWKDDEDMFRVYLHGWRLRKISTITKLDVIKQHAHIGNTRGKYAANRVIELLCSMFNRAIKDWGWQGANPAAGIRAFKERKRERFLDGQELPAFFQSLAQEPNEHMRDFMLVALLTGARRSNVQEMEWKEINFHRAEWLIPAEKAKSDEPLRIALTPVVLRILETRKASSMSKFVFPGRGKTGHVVEPKTAWKRILKRAGLTDLRLHDLRRTLGSWQSATGASLQIIGKSLGHESLEATKVYSRLNLDPVRESVARAQQAMLMAGGLGPAGLLEGK